MCIKLLKLRVCGCLRCCFVVRKRNDPNRKRMDDNQDNTNCDSSESIKPPDTPKTITTAPTLVKNTSNKMRTVYDTEISQKNNLISKNEVKTRLVRKPSEQTKTVNFVGISNQKLDKDDVIIWV